DRRSDRRARDRGRRRRRRRRVASGVGRRPGSLSRARRLAGRARLSALAAGLGAPSANRLVRRAERAATAAGLSRQRHGVADRAPLLSRAWAVAGSPGPRLSPGFARRLFAGVAWRAPPTPGPSFPGRSSRTTT